MKAQIVNLLSDLQDELGLALLFISHDLAIVEHLTHRVAVMYLGKIVEIADRRTLFAHAAPPLHARAALGGAGAGPDGAARTASSCSGDVPSPINPPSGCRFHTRCPYRVRPLPGGGAAAASGGRPGAPFGLPSGARAGRRGSAPAGCGVTPALLASLVARRCAWAELA